MPDSGLAWSSLRVFLPFDLDGLAMETGALRRRRGVGDGESLLRTLLLVGLPKSTLEQAAHMARHTGVARVSSVALFKRLVKSEAFLRSTFFQLLSQGVGPEVRHGEYRLLAVDATALCGPGAKGTDQRLHVVYDLGTGLPLSVDLTTHKGGESFSRHVSFGKGDLVLGDRGYAYEASLRGALRSGARILVRFEFDSLPLFTDYDERIFKEQAERCVPEFGEGPEEFCAYLRGWPAPLRVVGERNPEGKVVWYLTDLGPEELARGQARHLYYRRWQIELFFKRLKSILDLDALPTRDGPSARPWVWTKLILAALAVLLGHERFSPWEAGEPMERVRLRFDEIIRGLTRHGDFQTPQREAKRKKKKGKGTKTTLPMAKT